MKIILSTGAIRPPLTGIGRYALELARGLQARPEIASLRFYQSNRWVAEPDGLLGDAVRVATPTKSTKPIWSRYLRKPVWFRRWQQLWPYRDHLFHSPNYFVPRFAGPLAVATIHDLSIFKYAHTHPIDRLRQFEKEFPSSLKRTKHLITVSETTRLEVIAHFAWPAAKITAVHSGVSPDFAPRSAESIQAILASHGLAFGTYSLCVSTIEPRKNIDRLIMAYAALPEALRRRYPLVLAGSKGWLSEDLHALIARYQAAGWLHYLGFVADQDLPALYAGARLFAFPSTYEGFGLPVLEALASGVPVVTSDRSSLPEVAGGAALLVDPDDVVALRLAIARALEDAPWRAAAIARGLVVASGFTWQRCAAQTLAVYQKVWAGGEFIF